jgi:hypothetical protein
MFNWQTVLCVLLLTCRRSNPAEYATFLGEDFAYYVLGMAQDGTWGDEVRRTTLHTHTSFYFLEVTEAISLVWEASNNTACGFVFF